MSDPTTRPRRLRFGIFVAVLAALIAVAVWLGPPDVAALRDWVAGTGAAGPLVAVAGVGLGIVVMIPRTVMSIAVGMLFGWLPGFAYITLGCLLGAGAGFLMGRLLGRDYVADKLAAWSKRGSADPSAPSGWWTRALRWTERGLANADAWLVRHGVVGIWIARILPISHYGFLSYACGTASIRFRHFIGGTAIGSVPGALGYTAVGGAVLGPGGLKLALALALGLNAVSLTILALVRRRFGRVVDAPADSAAILVAAKSAED